MPRLKDDETLEIPSWIGGLQKNTAIALNEPGSLLDGQNLVPTQAGRMASRGGSRIVNTLHNDGGGAEVTALAWVHHWTSIGAIVVGYDTTTHKCYAWYCTQDMAFFSTPEANSRVDLSNTTGGTVVNTPASWGDSGGPPIPVGEELFEGIYLCDAQTNYANRRYLVALNQQPIPVSQGAGPGNSTKIPLFAFAGGSAQELRPYCLEVYNNVLFIAGYGDEVASDSPELVRHSFLGIAPSNSIAGGDASDGFDKLAYNILGAKGQRVTAMKQGRGFLLVAKADELYRISGAGRAYPGWQYATEMVMNTSGMGCSNPYALCFAEGYWYGLGAAGAFRTDGYSVEPIWGPRALDFQSLDNLDKAWIAYHPNRRLILFGVHPQGTSPASYPWIIWAWDIERQRWQPDWVNAVPTGYAHGGEVPTTTIMAPSAPPSAPVTSAITSSGYTASWTNGDASAQTEFWYNDALTGTWILNATVAAGITTVALTGLLGGGEYDWKVRHTKNGFPSAYSATAAPFTLIDPPQLAGDIGSLYAAVGAEAFPSLWEAPSFYAYVNLFSSPDGITYSPAGTMPTQVATAVTAGLYWKATLPGGAISQPDSDYSNVATS